MSSSLDEAYGAVERAYGQGDFAAALQAATALLPQIPAGRSDQLDQRLQLLIGHIQLYGLDQPQQAMAAYGAVLRQSSDPSYRQLAGEGLERCRQVEPAAEPMTVQRAEPMASEAAPATPWLEQLSDPDAALELLRQTRQPISQPPAREPAPKEPPAVALEGTASAPWAEAAPSAELADEPEPINAPPEPVPMEPARLELATPQGPDQQPLDLDPGLLVVKLPARPN